MAKAKSGKPLVIVESPTKARTIGKFLGSGFAIEASVGHIRDLPANAAEIPAELKKEKWARLGIDIDNEFLPLYVVPPGKQDQIRKLRKLLADAPTLYLATDEDREGESISWHLLEVLKPKVAIHRLVFHEITKEAIQEALANPREIDTNLVEAQETRRLVDRLYGYSVSPLLWKKIRPRLSAGRVQSVAVRLVVEREEARIRFHAARYFDLAGTFAAKGQAPFDATLASVDGRRVAVGKDFDPDTGRLRSAKEQPLHLDEAAATKLLAELRSAQATVESLEQKPYTERPAAPFTTSTLQQEAGRKLRFGAQRTMRAAQRLYENGWITYMRTDSTTLSQEALGAARTLIAETYGREHLPPEPRAYATKVRNAQEAHEAIRPAGAHFRHPREASELGEDERRLYELIWQRTVASQMKDARGQRTTLTVRLGRATFQASGKTIEYPGYRLAYVEDVEEADAEIAEQERILPKVQQGDRLTTEALRAEGHQTEPPARLTEASLIKEMEARGIGRPSTYASILETILAREYCFKKGTALVPTFTAFAVVQLMKRFLGHLVDYDFTAKMEDDLDEISNGKVQRLAYLNRFYLGNGSRGLRDTLDHVDEKIDPKDVCSIRIQRGDDPVGVTVRVGRYGPYLEGDGKRVTLPDEIAPDELTAARAQELLQQAAQRAEPIGTHAGLPVYVKNGRFGPYVQLGDNDPKGEKPKMASLLAGMDPKNLDLDTAVALLSLPRSLGKATLVAPGTTEAAEHEIRAANGRYGPYLLWGKETRSIPEGESPLTITKERAIELLQQPKQRGRGGPRSAPKARKELGAHPRGGATVKLMDGRFGVYVTDGTTNATVPKGENPDELTLARAVELLDARAARGPAPKRRGRRPARSRG
ncbi:MAG: type I DNA topoisomerase [Planctomycetes bacterium]|nr:type I DNA topoisomerase [Planctomycetota bacterium]